MVLRPTQSLGFNGECQLAGSLWGLSLSEVFSPLPGNSMCSYYFISSKEQTPTICFLFLLLRTYQGIFAEQRQCEFKSLPHESQKTVHSFQTAVSPAFQISPGCFRKPCWLSFLCTSCLSKATQHTGGRKHPSALTRGSAQILPAVPVPSLLLHRAASGLSFRLPLRPTTGPWHNKCSGRMYFILGKVIKPLLWKHLIELDCFLIVINVN